MIAAVLLAFKLTIEIIASCHCDRWIWIEDGARCIEPRDYPRCELISGWHYAAWGVSVCSKGDCE